MRFTTLFGIVALGLGMTTLPLAAKAACSNATLKGTYGYASTVVQDSFGVPSQGVPPHFLELAGLYQFDGKGSATESFTFARNDGAVGTSSDLIVYTVAADCTFKFSQDNGETFSGVIVLDGQQFFFIETSGGCCDSTAIIRRGQAVRIHTGT